MLGLLLVAGAATLGACANGGGSDDGRGTLAPAVAGPGQVLVDAQLVDAEGAPLVGVPCRLDPLAPSALHASLLGLVRREAATDVTGRVAFQVPLAEVLGTYGGRFYRLTALDAAGRQLATADVFADASGARIGTIRRWSGDVRALPDAAGGIEVRWSGMALAEQGTVVGYRPALLSAAGEPVAEALVSAFADRIRFDPAGAGAQAGQAPAASADVRAHLTRQLASGQAFLAIQSEAAPLPQP